MVAWAPSQAALIANLSHAPAAQSPGQPCRATRAAADAPDAPHAASCAASAQKCASSNHGASAPQRPERRQPRHHGILNTILLIQGRDRVWRARSAVCGCSAGRGASGRSRGSTRGPGGVSSSRGWVARGVSGGGVGAPSGGARIESPKDKKVGFVSRFGHWRSRFRRDRICMVCFLFCFDANFSNFPKITSASTPIY